jgi:murein L,D-transpeptidase YcbB/YkuD
MDMDMKPAAVDHRPTGAGRHLFLMLWLLLGVASAAPAVTTPPEPVRPEPGEAAGPAGTLLEPRLVGLLTLYTPRAVERFYAERDWRPFWIDRDGPTAAARSLLEAVRASGDEGLNPAEYHLPEIEPLLLATPLNGADAARLELLFSDAFLVLARHLAEGRRRPADVDPDWHIPVQAGNPGDLLRQVAAGRPVSEALDSQRPAHPGYRRLREALVRYRALANSGGWPELPAGEKLESGMRDARVPILRQRLQITGDAPSRLPADPEFFDGELDAAVRAFQSRHGLEVDGVVGRRTRAALAASAGERVRQLVINLERWRWLPRDFGPRHIQVNVAAFELEYLERDQPPLDMKVIIGRTYRSTPAFTERMTYLELNPYWNVPKRIARLDLLPKLERDPEYFDHQGIRILSDWSADAEVIPPAEMEWEPGSGRAFPYRLQQLPGPLNALGRIKFMLPNRFDIYLHDTPSRNLFQRTVRTFSSGCIRLEKPIDLALRVLEGSNWNEASLLEAIDSGEHRIISLPRSIPVYLIYLTAWGNAAGVVNFRNDIYDRDRRMEQALFGYPRH